MGQCERYAILNPAPFAEHGVVAPVTSGRAMAGLTWRARAQREGVYVLVVVGVVYVGRK